MEAAAGAGNSGRGKDIENIIQADKEEEDEEEIMRYKKFDEDAMEVDKSDSEKVESGDVCAEDVKEDHDSTADDAKEKHSPSVENGTSAVEDKNEKEVATSGSTKRTQEDSDEEDEIVAPSRKKKKSVVKDSDEESEDVSRREFHSRGTFLLICFFIDHYPKTNIQSKLIFHKPIKRGLLKGVGGFKISGVSNAGF